MKAAKDGQDGINCEDAYTNCPTAREDQNLRQNQAMLATYQDIDKLVHARKLWKNIHSLSRIAEYLYVDSLKEQTFGLW